MLWFLKHKDFGKVQITDPSIIFFFVYVGVVDDAKKVCASWRAGIFFHKRAHDLSSPDADNEFAWCM
jgi:hypothetical protein